MKENICTVSHPIFLKCCTYLTDPFWKYLFEDMAYGKCPYGIIIKDNCVYSVLKHREFTYSLEETSDVERMCQELCAVLSTKLQILSEKDHFRYRKECQGHVSNYMNTMENWNEIRKKNLKDLLLEQYSLSQRDKFDYSFAFTRQLFAIIFIGIQFKTILSRNIRYSNRTIDSIDGIECQRNRIVCSFNIFIAKNASLSPVKSSRFVTKLSLSWRRYLSHL